MKHVPDELCPVAVWVVEGVLGERVRFASGEVRHYYLGVCCAIVESVPDDDDVITTRFVTLNAEVIR